MKQKLFLLLVFIVGALHAQTISIPDANFEQTLIDLGYDTVLNGEVVSDSIVNITEIDLSDRNISNLDGIEGFTNLEVLRCGRNSLTELDLSQNLALTFVSGFLNELTSVDLSQNSLLEIVQLSSNQLTQLDVSQNSKLKILAINYNFLQEIDVSNNPELFRLAFEVNNISALNIANNLLLEELFVTGNNIAALDVTLNTKLTNLDCSNNRINELDVTFCTELKTLKFDRNSIDSIDLQQNTKLDFLMCHSNQLTELDLTGNTLLTYLSASGNNLSELEVRHNPLLRFFFVHDNQITQLDLSNNPDLFRVICNNNALTSLDIKNGNNGFIDTFNALNNQDLQCIQVDNIFFSNANWNQVDNGVLFSTACATLATEDLSLKQSISLYPNPTQDRMKISHQGNITIQPIAIYTLNGTKIQQKKFDNSSINDEVDLSRLSSGVYLLKLVSEEGQWIQKIIKN
jgi:hypothetical protein